MLQRKESVVQAEGQDVSRRGFLAGVVGVGTLGALASVGELTACATSAEGTSQNETALEWQKETDVVIVGGGIGGCLAALNAQAKGANITIVEAFYNLGGTAQLSGGALHLFGSKNFEDFKKFASDVDPVYGQVLVETFNNEIIPFMADTGAPYNDVFPVPLAVQDIYGETWDAISYSPMPEGGRAFYDYLQQYIEDAGGEVLLQTRGTELYLNDAGAVVGLKAFEKAGAQVNIKAKAVILATGGFANNKEELVKYFGPDADISVARTLPYNDGAGLRMGLAAGAATSKSFGHFYGHTQIYPPIIPEDPEEFEKMDIAALIAAFSTAQNLTTRAVLVDMYGNRFVDESRTDDYTTQKLSYLEGGKALMIQDQALFNQWGVPELVSTYRDMTAEECWDAQGIVYAKADTLEALAEAVKAWGYSSHLIDTVQAFNAAIDAGTNERLPIPRAGNLVKVAEPPFYAVQVCSGVSHTYGGLKFTTKSEVLRPDNTVVPGLYVDGGVGGGVYRVNYGGSVALAGTFGFIAGGSAAEYASTLE